VIAEEFAVIGGEDDDPRAAGLFAARGEVGDERRELGVEVFDEAEVAGLGGVQRGAFEADAVAAFVAGRRERFPLHPVAAGGGREFCGEVFFEV
jgi:hypothetical protein